MTNAATKLVEVEVEADVTTADVMPITKVEDVLTEAKVPASKSKTNKTPKGNKETQSAVPSVDTSIEVTSSVEVASKKQAVVKAEPKQQAKKAKRPARTRPTKQEIIERQSNPTTIFAGKQKTLNLELVYGSDILHEYLQMNQSTMLSAYERIAGLMRMVSNDKTAYRHVSTWVNHNVQICQEQVKELQAQREAIVEDLGADDMQISINVPDDYHTTFEASHPIAHKMLAILLLVDNELNQSEELFLGGLIDDEAYGKLRNQATTIVRGSVDRIFKATTPGMRNNGRYSPQELAAWIRQGNQLMFADLPQRFEHIVNGQ